MKKFKVGKDFDYITGYLKYGHAEVIVEAETEEEAKALAEEKFNDFEYKVVVDAFDIEDHGELENDSYIIEQ